MVKPNVKVLLVEDSEDDYHLTKILFDRAPVTKFDLEWVNTYDAALPIIKKNEHDVYLIDYHLGNRSGLELLREAVALGCKAPIILLAGLSDRFIDVSAMNAGAIDYLEKDRVDSALLERSIRYAIERKKSEEMLRVREAQIKKLNADLELRISAFEQSEERLRLFVEHAPAAVAMLDKNMDYLMVSHKWLSDYKLSREEVIGRSHYVVFPNLSEHWKLIHQNCLSGAIERSDEDRFEQADGTVSWLRWEIRPWHGSDDQVAGIMIFSEDITKRKEAESVLKETMDRFRQVTENIDEVFWMTSLDKKQMLYVSPAYEKVWGRTCESLYKDPMSYLQAVHPEDKSLVVEGFPKQVSGPYHAEYRIIRPDGSVRWIRDRTFPVRSESGEIYRIAGTTTDITEMRMAEEERAKLLYREQVALEASHMKSKFLANMSHEIRTPINGVIGMTDLLLDTSLNPDQKECALTIKRSADSLLTIINDILDFSKVEAGKLDLEIIDFDLMQIIDDLRNALSYSAKRKGIHIAASIQDGLPARLRGDPARLRQVLTNLTSNAIKFTEKGEVRIKVLQEKDSTPAKPRLRFEVSDTGIGIPKDALHRLFQAFSQVDSSTTRRFGGTGLGLSISRRLVELMGGNIGVVSEEGQGAMFWFVISFEPATATAEAKLPVKNSKATRGLKHVKILVAEDNVVNQRVAIKALQKLGCRVQTVGNGNEVMEALQGISYDLILMDCHMPEMDGYETTKLIRSNKNFSFQGIPIIALTANAIKGDREKCLAAGMSDYVSKPIDFPLLAEKIQQWIPANRQKAAETGKGGAMATKSIPKDISLPPNNDASPGSSARTTIDYSALEKLMDFEDDISAFLDIFFKTTPERIEKICKAVEDHDARALIYAAHCLKSSCAYAGARRMQQLCLQLEESGNELSPTEASKLVKLLEEEYVTSKEALKVALKELSQRQ